ncbi:Hint domain-containing protein [Roseicyclus mahoneyensis]|uniref:Hint domain-containing protein n=1 Tax=Roseicyclus mahoneyensis TaxID=164332 RepID=A0A316GQM7_9RHOB|nr:Hint domain-containing protein [Roseicyclus mahoneyensis]PWK57277.1 Hint domain-containing protein [Roseicyclus mahoneyensis]
MANFPATHWVMLMGPSRAGDSSLAWTGTHDQADRHDVIDTAPSGALDQTDTFVGGQFTGFYLDIEGKFYGVFLVHSIYAVPYIKADHDIFGSAALSAGVTTLYSPTLATAANCFLDGTHIATPDGPCAIERLQPGDLVTTTDGGSTPVIWVWRQDITNIFGMGDGLAPVRLSEGCLGPGCPSRDLTVTADHAICIDGLLINAGALVNGTTIRAAPQHQLPARFAYWHVETEAHCLLLAEGCPAESLVPYADRAGFADHAAYLARYGRDRPIAEMALPRVTAARHLPPALRARLGIDRAA